MYHFISFLAALQGILLAATFFIKKAKHPAGKMFAWYLLVFSLGMLERFVETNIYGAAGNFLLLFLKFSNFLYGPLLFLFVYFLAQKEPKFKLVHFLHLAPFSIASSMGLADLVLNNKLFVNGWGELVLFELLVIHILTYNILAIKRLSSSQKHLKQLYPNIEQKEIKWLQIWMLLITSIYFISFAITHLVIFGWKESNQFYIVVQLLIAISIYLMSYRIMLYPSLFTLLILGKQEKTPSLQHEKYLRSGLRPEKASQYKQQLLGLMENEKPYLDPDLNIHMLSEKLGISRNHLTQLINESFQKNFYEFVNAYRVEETKKLIIDLAYAHLTLSGIGLEAGFKSKSAFNSNFKQSTGFTPSDWKKSQLNIQNPRY